MRTTEFLEPFDKIDLEVRTNYFIKIITLIIALALIIPLYSSVYVYYNYYVSITFITVVNADIILIMTFIGSISLQMANKKNVTILNNSKPGIFFEFDPYLISIVLRNLLSNATKFSFAGGVVLIASEFIFSI